MIGSGYTGFERRVNRIVYSEFNVTTSDGCGYRFSIYFQGCHIHCIGCHNKGIWDIKEGAGKH